MKTGTVAFFFAFLVCLPLKAEDNHFLTVRDRYQWAIVELMEHKRPEVRVPGREKGMSHTWKRREAVLTKPPFQAKTYKFQAETDRAKVDVTVTAMENNFILDVVSDGEIEGWSLKKQSTSKVFLSGGPSENSFRLKIRVSRPYIRDYSLTLFVTKDNDPAFVRLF